MKKILLAAFIATGFTATAIAADNPAKDRQLLMKNVGAAVGVSLGAYESHSTKLGGHSSPPARNGTQNPPSF